MSRFIIVTFGFMAWGFYELSGGSDFKVVRPEQMTAAAVQTETLAPALQTTPVVTVASKQAAQVKPAEAKVILAKLSVSEEDVVAQRSTGFFTVLDTVKAESIAPRAVVEVTEVDTAADLDAEIRIVTGNKVNMRNGPGKTHDVLARLTRGEQVEVLQDQGDGWVKLRVVSTNRVGWMADFLLASAE